MRKGCCNRHDWGPIVRASLPTNVLATMILMSLVREVTTPNISTQLSPVNAVSRLRQWFCGQALAFRNAALAARIQDMFCAVTLFCNKEMGFTRQD